MTGLEPPNRDLSALVDEPTAWDYRFDSEEEYRARIAAWQAEIASTGDRRVLNMGAAQ